MSKNQKVSPAPKPVAPQPPQNPQISGYIVGEIRAFCFGPLPKKLIKQGWIECDGRSLANEDYPELFGAIGNNYGTDTPNIAFKVPDLRGYFLRGWNHGSGNDPDANIRDNFPNGAVGDKVGSKEADQVGPHTHLVTDLGNNDGGVGINPGTHMEPGRGTPINLQTHNNDGRESRPKNVSVMYAIYSGRPG